MYDLTATGIARPIHIGRETKLELFQLLLNAGIQLNPIAKELFADARFHIVEKPIIVDSFQTTVAALGFPEGGTIAQIVQAAALHGLTPCPLELGPYLRLALLEQAEGATGFPQIPHQAPHGSITVVSEPLSEDDETPKGFYLRRIDGTLWLRGYNSWSGHVWNPQDALVFSCDYTI